jgi:hypothetical protein
VSLCISIFVFISGFMQNEVSSLVLGFVYCFGISGLGHVPGAQVQSDTQGLY